MPQYRKEHDWNGLKVICRPKPSLRKVFKFWPFHVGQKILLTLSIEKTGTDNNFSLANYNIVSKFPGMAEYTIHTTFRGKTDVNEIWLDPVSIRHIGAEGEIEYRLCKQKVFDRGLPIFTTKAISPDARNAYIGTIIFSTIFGLFIRELLNLILSLF